MRFKEITIKAIGNAASFTRTSISNCFQTKEEIFLALLQRAYGLWVERLVEFKVVYRRSLTEVRNCLDQFFPAMTVRKKQDFIFSFFPFMFSIYPYTVVTEKQREAMALAKANYVYMSIYEITCAEVKSCWVCVTIDNQKSWRNPYNRK